MQTDRKWNKHTNETFCKRIRHFCITFQLKKTRLQILRNFRYKFWTNIYIEEMRPTDVFITGK